YQQQLLEEDLKQKSYFARMFDITDVHSLISQTMIRNPEITEPQVMVANALRKPLALFGSLQKNLANMVTPKAAAQAVDYDYGFSEYGFSLGELQNEKYADPFENAAVVEPRLNELNEKYGKCYGTSVQNNTLTVNE